jgi:HEAT repeat protein
MLISIARTLAAMGRPEGKPELMRQLDGPGADFASDCLAGVGATDAAPLLLERLRDPKPRERAHFAVALAELGAREAGPHILTALRRPDTLDDGEVESCLRALRLLEVRAAYPDFFAALHHPEDDVREEGVRGLAALGDSAAVPALIARMRDEKEKGSVRIWAARSLCLLGATEGIEPLLAWASEGSWVDLAVLNRLREPKAWEKLRAARGAPGRLLTNADALEYVARKSGLPCRRAEAATRAERVWLRQPAYESPRRGEMTDVVDVLDGVTMYAPISWVLEAEEIRVVASKQALEFWKEWARKR